MRLTPASGRTALAARGFTLLEVVIASALLLMTVAAVTTAVTGLSRGASRQLQATKADRVLQDEAAYLIALPYCAPTYPANSWGAGPPTLPAADLVAEVFPHAVATMNDAAARYVADGTEDDAPAGSFVTRVVRGDVTVERIARFVSSRGADPLAQGLVDGWAVWGSSPPPAAALAVHLVATGRGSTRECVLVRSALSPWLASRDEAMERGGS